MSIIAPSRLDQACSAAGASRGGIYSLKITQLRREMDFFSYQPLNPVGAPWTGKEHQHSDDES
jgi:hypothetical protein